MMSAEHFTSLSLAHLSVEYPMKEADLVGAAGKAWLIEPGRPEHSATLGSWLVNIPGAHALWDWCVVAVVHLREESHLPAPKFLYEGAEYEFTILTVDPEAHPSPDPELVADEGVEFLLPADVKEQFHGLSDADAARISALAVSHIVDGRILPFPDFQPDWKDLLDQTIKTFRTGCHVN